MLAKKEVTLLLCLLSSLACAEDKINNSKYYAQGSLGYAMGVAPGGNFEQNTFGSAGVVSAAIGYRFNENFRSDWSFEYRGGYKNKFAVTNLNRTTDTQYTLATSYASFFNAYYDIIKIKEFTPYVLLGAGFSRNITKSDGIMTVKSGKSSSYYVKEGIANNFAWKIGAGLNYELNRNTYVGFNYQFVDLGKVKTGRSIKTLNRTFTGNCLEGKLQSNEFIFNLGHTF